MSSLPYVLYLTNVLNNIGVFCVIGGFSGALISSIIIMFGLIENEPDILNIGKRIFIVACVCSGLSILIPDQKTVTMMVATSYADSFLNNEKVQGVVDPSINLLKVWIEDETKKLKK
jgi:hypothetical protein